MFGWLHDYLKMLTSTFFEKKNLILLVLWGHSARKNSKSKQCIFLELQFFFHVLAHCALHIADFNYYLQHTTILVSGPHQWVFFSRPRKSKVVIIMTFLKNMTCQLWKELVIKMMIHDKSYLLYLLKVAKYTGMALIDASSLDFLETLWGSFMSKPARTFTESVLNFCFDMVTIEFQNLIMWHRNLTCALVLHTFPYLWLLLLLSNQRPFANGPKVM